MNYWRGFLCLFLFLIIPWSSKAQSQQSNPINIEAGWGVHYPAKPAPEFLHRGYIDVRSFYIGGQYTLNGIWRLRATYGYNEFVRNPHNGLSLTQHKFVGEAMLNFVPVLQKSHRDSESFLFFLHGGLGMTLGKSKFLYGVDKTFTVQGGIMPTYQISPDFAIQLDMVLVVDFFQAYNIDGVPISDRVGNYYLANIGLTYSFGK